MFGNNHYDDSFYSINEVLIDDLALELNNDADDITNILSEVEMLMYDLNVELKGNVYEAFASKFNSYKTNIAAIRDKLSGYSIDLMRFKENYKNNDKTVANMFNEFSADVKVETHIVNEKNEGGLL